MRVGLLVTSIGNFGQRGFYNAQEIGLAKALEKYVDEVMIYKLIPSAQSASKERVDGCKNVWLHLIPARSLGINGFFSVKKLDKSLDVLIYFSDTQLMVPSVYKWAKKHHVQFHPYIGVLESHSTSGLKKTIIDTLFIRNLHVYRKCHCLTKTPTVKHYLHQLGVQEISVTPVGLDLTLLHQNAQTADVNQLKCKYGFKPEDKVLLFIGRLIEEKQPLRMLDIFSEIYRRDSRYKLLMVGKGPMQEKVNERISALGIADFVTQIEQIQNSDIWELYRMADCFVNLNQQEIFGMAILEAMYYGCKVVAWEAPGPRLIIENEISGYLVSDNQAVADSVLNMKYDPEQGKQRVLENFTWDNMARFVSKAACMENKR